MAAIDFFKDDMKKNWWKHSIDSHIFSTLLYEVVACLAATMSWGWTLDPGPLGSLGGYSNTSFWGEKTDFPTFYNVQSYCLLAAMWYIQAPWAGLNFDCLVFYRVFYLEIMSLTIYYPKYHPRLWAEIQFS